MRRALVAATAVITLFAGLPAEAAIAVPGPGGSGIGDVYFPDYGNGGYDVSHYDIRLRYFPDTDRLTGTTTILARATADLSRFNLDFALPVTSVRVNGFQATFATEGSHELVVTPARPVLANQSMVVVVQYAGVPSQVQVNGFTAWVRSSDGGALAVGEPEIAWWWFPSNDQPLDKATFDISVAVPDGVEVLSNGVMPRPPARELLGWSRWSWRTTQPTATYLAFLAIGQYEIVTDVAPNGQPVINAYALNLGEFAPAARASIERTAEVVEWSSDIFGPYPFEAQGGVAVPLNSLGFALETQTRPVYSSGFWRRGSNMYVVVHEIAHQWFGDSVALAQWRDIWLNEGFATYAEWLWSEHVGEGTAQEVFDFTYNFYAPDNSFWRVLPGNPGAPLLFDGAVYDRGGMTLHQLRLKVGDEEFFRLLREWTSSQRHGNGTHAEFHALAEQISGQDLDAFFQTWLFTPGRPALTPPAGPLAQVKELKQLKPKQVRQPTSWIKIEEGHELLHELSKHHD